MVDAILYSDKYYLSDDSLEKIYQALVFLSDKVLLSENCRPHPRLDMKSKGNMLRKLTDLAISDMLETWGYPDTNLRIEDSLGKYIPEEKRSTIPPDIYLDAYDSVVRSIASYGQELIQTPHYQGGHQLEGVTEFVELKNSLWPIVVANTLGASRVITKKEAVDWLDLGLAGFGRFEQIEGPVLEQFINLQNLNPVSALTIDDIIDLRKHMSKFRDELFLPIVNKAVGSYPGLVNEFAEKLTREYTEIIESMAVQEPLWKGLSKKGALSIAGFFIPLAKAIPFISTIRNWWKLKNSPALLVLKLKEKMTT